MVKTITGARLGMLNGTGGQRGEKDSRDQRESIDIPNPPVYGGLNPT
jgi:hypothetical protein